jgi:hypothetical protein
MTDERMVVTVGANTRPQGSGWTVETYTPQGIRTTESRWTTRERAIIEGRKLAEQIKATLAIY